MTSKMIKYSKKKSKKNCLSPLNHITKEKKLFQENESQLFYH